MGRVVRSTLLFPLGNVTFEYLRLPRVPLSWDREVWIGYNMVNAHIRWGNIRDISINFPRMGRYRAGGELGSHRCIPVFRLYQRGWISRYRKL